MDRDGLMALAERAEKATGPDREIDLAIWRMVDPRAAEMEAEGRAPLRWLHCYTESLDAAMTLVPEGYDWAVFRTNGGLTIHAWCGDRVDHFGETPALALTAASLRTLAATSEGSAS